MRRVRLLLQTFFIANLLLWLTGCTHFFFQPLKQHLASPEQYNIQCEDIYFEGNDGKLHGWWFPARVSTHQKSKATILFLHGNGENISTHSGLIYWLTQYQYDVFIFDYRGYGKSEGSVNVTGALADITHARKYVKSRNKTGNKLFVIGHSLGASLGIVNLAMHNNLVDGIILVSPFSDYKKITREMMAKSWVTWAFQWPISLTINGEYNPINFVEKLPTVPKLFIYSETDSVINPQHVKSLYAKASQPKFIEQVDGKHNSLFSKKATQQLIVRYLNQWLH